MSKDFDLGAYKTVAQRMEEFFDKHPEGSLRPLDPAKPFTVEVIDGRHFIFYAAVAMRTPDDPTPGIGMAWEPFPGKTTFTKDSELQNAETSAWGRAILAAGASDTKNGVASRDEVQARNGPPANEGLQPGAQKYIRNLAERHGVNNDALELLVRKTTDNRTDDLAELRPGDEFEELKGFIRKHAPDDPTRPFEEANA